MPLYAVSSFTPFAYQSLAMVWKATANICSYFHTHRAHSHKGEIHIHARLCDILDWDVSPPFMHAYTTHSHSANTCFRKYLRFMQSACVEFLYFCCIVAVAVAIFVVVVVHLMNTMTKIGKTIYVTALVTAAAVAQSDCGIENRKTYSAQNISSVLLFRYTHSRAHVKEEKQQRQRRR